MDKGGGGGEGMEGMSETVNQGRRKHGNEMLNVLGSNPKGIHPPYPLCPLYTTHFTYLYSFNVDKMCRVVV